MPEELEQHYILEKKLAAELKGAVKEDRKQLYKKAYNKLFKELPALRAVVQKTNKDDWDKPSPQMRWLRRFLRPETVFMEVGAGNCKLSFEISRLVKKVYAVEASEEIAHHQSYPENLELIISDASSLNIPDKTIDVIYSRHLIEHLHPEDALEHLRNAYQTLAQGGLYICVTPNAIFGPHDASKYFDKVATGLHLKEYSVSELSRILKATGFSEIRFHIKIFGIIMTIPLASIKIYESVCALLPHFLRRRVGSLPFFRMLLTIRLLARK